MKPITYKLINKKSEIGFSKMELIDIDNGQFLFKCHYKVKFKGKTTNEIDLISFNVNEYYSIIHLDYKIVNQ
jgi:hypothetical protein